MVEILWIIKVSAETSFTVTVTQGLCDNSSKCGHLENQRTDN